MYCNGDKIKYDVIYGIYYYESEIRINIASLGNGNGIEIYWNNKLVST